MPLRSEGIDFLGLIRPFAMTHHQTYHFINQFFKVTQYRYTISNPRHPLLYLLRSALYSTTAAEGTSSGLNYTQRVLFRNSSNTVNLDASIGRAESPLMPVLWGPPENRAFAGRRLFKDAIVRIPLAAKLAVHLRCEVDLGSGKETAFSLLLARGTLS